MSSDNTQLTLADICTDVSYGYTESATFEKIGPKFLRITDIQGGVFDWTKVPFCQASPQDAKKYRLEVGDIVVARTGNSTGENAQVFSPPPPAVFASYLIRFRPDNNLVNPFFVGYQLRTERFRQHVLSVRGGSAQPGANAKQLGLFPVQMIDRSQQNAVVNTLRAIDDRITLLREINQTLEAIAQALFKSWFVDFDPVRAKAEGRVPEGIDAETAALFPDEFEESELGIVPKGWVVGRLNDFAKLKGGKMLSKEHFSVDAEFPVYGGAGEMGRSNLSNADGFVITVGRVGAYCGQYFWHSGKAWVNNNASHVIPHNVNYSVWLYQWLRSVDMDLIKKGAAQPFVSNGDIENLKIILPAASAIEEFVNVCEPLFKRMSSVLASILTLTNLRDTLLPRLISGQLRIADAETELEKAKA
jgi:type I restriction enzyme S subunit